MRGRPSLPGIRCLAAARISRADRSSPARPRVRQRETASRTSWSVARTSLSTSPISADALPASVCSKRRASSLLRAMRESWCPSRSCRSREMRSRSSEAASRAISPSASRNSRPVAIALTQLIVTKLTTVTRKTGGTSMDRGSPASQFVAIHRTRSAAFACIARVGRSAPPAYALVKMKRLKLGAPPSFSSVAMPMLRAESAAMNNELAPASCPIDLDGQPVEVVGVTPRCPRVDRCEYSNPSAGARQEKSRRLRPNKSHKVRREKRQPDHPAQPHETKGWSETRSRCSWVAAHCGTF